MGLVGLIMMVFLCPNPPRGAAETHGDGVTTHSSYIEDVKYLLKKYDLNNKKLICFATSQTMTLLFKNRLCSTLIGSLVSLLFIHSLLKYFCWISHIRFPFKFHIAVLIAMFVCSDLSKSYVWSSLGVTALAFLTGALAFWLPTFLARAHITQGLRPPCTGETCNSTDRFNHFSLTCICLTRQNLWRLLILFFTAQLYIWCCNGGYGHHGRSSGYNNIQTTQG